MLFRDRRVISLLLITIATIGLYFGTFKNGFVLDDQTLLEQNQKLAQGIRAIPGTFLSEYWDGTGFNFGVYRPLTLSSFILEHAALGLTPFSAHLINLLLYTVAVWIFYLLMFEIFRRDRRRESIASATALFFLVSPLPREIVAYAKSRDELLCLVGGLASLYFLVRWPDRLHVLVFSLLGYLFALFAKETAVIFPFIGFALLYFQNPKRRPRFWLSILISFCLVTTFYFLLRNYALGGPNLSVARDPVTFPYTDLHNWWNRGSTALWIGAKYIALNFVPWPLLSDYSFNQIPFVEFTSLNGFLLVAGAVVLTSYTIHLYVKRSAVGLGAVLFGVALFIPLVYSFWHGFSMADRMMALPSMGGALLLSALALWLPRPASIAVVTIAAGVFAALTFQRTFDWRSNRSLLEADYPKARENSKINFLLGRELERAAAKTTGAESAALLNRAVSLLEASLSISPGVPEVLTELGVTYGQRGQFDRARTLLDRALEIRVNAETLYFSGLLDLREQNFELARKRFEEALRLSPQYLRAQLELEKLKN